MTNANQQAFNAIIRHLRKQGRKSSIVSLDGTEKCQYRSTEGLKCAIGCLIPDEEYRDDLEGKDVLTIAQRISSLAGLDVGLLIRMQQLHDCHAVKEWEGLFVWSANFFKLTIPAKENVGEHP